MYRTTITIISPTLTFSTVQEFVDEIEQYFQGVSYPTWIDGINDYISLNLIENVSQSLLNDTTLETVIDWVDEASYNSFYNSSGALNSITAAESAGYIRTVVEEIF